ncbi:Rv3235 family protein [Streptomyces boncukensis]|uniref:Rv3235 family protein n=1 Tax=Streptomyces boncukensis TaxID=2711219 RepID=UPI0019CF581F|nr:Rv3235 family protein [Streptomyces boncukensis]
MTTPATPDRPSHGSAPRGRPKRSGPPTRPPGRRDSRRPADSALRAAAHRSREQQPPFWFARRLLLVLSGQLPVHALLSHARGAAYDRLAQLARQAPLRPGGTDRTTPAVLEARGTQPRPGVIEAFARIATGGRQRAMAFRLEFGPQGRWQCTAIELDMC